MGSRLYANSSQVRKRIERHTFDDEEGEEYDASAFGGFGDYFRRKRIKLQNLDAQLRADAAAEQKPQIFKGVVAHVSGFTQPSLHVLHRELVQHGAGFLQYLDSKTMATHIIASSMPPKKAVDYNAYRIVKPAWVVDSIAAGRLLPWSDYRVLEEDSRQKVLKVGGEGKVLSEPSAKTRAGYREQTDNSVYTSQLRMAESQYRSPMTTTTTRQDVRSAGTSRVSRLPEENNSADHDPAYRDRQPATPEKRASLMGADSLAEKRNHQEGASGSPTLDKRRRLDDAPKNPTSEEHNAWLLSDPKIRDASCANPNFLQQFYSESRLHHLSTWKAELKSKMQKLAAGRSAVIETPPRKPGVRRYIMHIDFDSFFCAVSLKKHREYVNKPAVVAHSPGTASEIASCNYVARKFGVKNGMWMKRALELCPDIKVLPYDFPAYEEASRLFYEVILEVGGIVQSVSVDEALLDVTAIALEASGSDGDDGSESQIQAEHCVVEELAQDIRSKIKGKTGCDVSVGLGGNILLAKVALRRAKPAGQYHVKPEQVLDIIQDLGVESLPGVAGSTGSKLHEIGVKLVKHLRLVSKERLSGVLGPKTGERLWEYARGIDRVEVGEQSARKSVSAEVNWGIRFVNQQEADDFVHNLCKELEKRLLNKQVKGKQLVMKIMRRSPDAPLDTVKHLGHGQCDTFNKSVLFRVATCSAEVMGKEAVSILRSYKFSPGDLRGLGVQLVRLEPITPSSQKTLSFGVANVPKALLANSKRSIDDIEDDSPQKRRAAPISPRAISADKTTPRRTTSLPSVPAVSSVRGPIDLSGGVNSTPLNISGTQFILPPNPDPKVLAELPNDIRAKLMAQVERQKHPDTLPVPVHGGAPLPTQVDPEVFAALPEDVRAEVLATYGRKDQPQQPQQPQQLQPHPTWDPSPPRDQPTRSPSASRVAPPAPGPRKRGRPRKFEIAVPDGSVAIKGGIRGMLGIPTEPPIDPLPEPAAVPAQQRHQRSPQRPPSRPTADLDIGGLEGLDLEFLAELPDDVRREVIQDHRRKQAEIRRVAAATAAAVIRRPSADAQPVAAQPVAAQPAASGQTTPHARRKHFPDPPPKMQFPGSDMTSVSEIQDMLEAWYTNTRDDGPHDSDVAVLDKYLRRVVLEERDMEKARLMVKMLQCAVVVDIRANPTGVNGKSRKKGIEGWARALDRIKEAVRGAVRERGLGTLKI